MIDKGKAIHISSAGLPPKSLMMAQVQESLFSCTKRTQFTPY
jgi:hypothetical protein